MLKLLLGIGVEILVAVLFAGLILALAIPLLNRNVPDATGGMASAIVIVGVLAGAVGVALFRPGSTIRRCIQRRTSSPGRPPL